MVNLSMTLRLALNSRSCYMHRCAIRAANYSSSASSTDVWDNTEVHTGHKRQLDIFSSHKAKLAASRVPRVEKIEVNFLHMGIGDGATMLMNKGLSTPLNCAQHLSQNYVKDSVIALVRKSPDTSKEVVAVEANHEMDEANESNQKSSSTVDSNTDWIPWDMHRPLDYDCDLKLLKFDTALATSEEMMLVNDAYWNTCAVLLGAVAKQAFKDNAMVKLVHLPRVDVKSGAFCYDVELRDNVVGGIHDSKWYKDDGALIQLTKVARHVISQNHIFERIELPREEAMNIFSDNEFMLDRLNQTYSTVQNSSYVPIYKFGPFLDVIDGPLLPSTSFIFHYVVTAIHRISTADNESSLWRFQGLSLPKPLQVHHAIWAMLERRAKRLIRKDLPFDGPDDERFDVPLHGYSSIENRTKRYNLATGQWLQDEWMTSKDMKS